MKLYSIAFPIIIFAVFGWGVSVLERCADEDGKATKACAKAEVKGDYKDFDAFMKTGEQEYDFND